MEFVPAASVPVALLLEALELVAPAQVAQVQRAPRQLAPAPGLEPAPAPAPAPALASLLEALVPVLVPEVPVLPAQGPGRIQVALAAATVALVAHPPPAAVCQDFLRPSPRRAQVRHRQIQLQVVQMAQEQVHWARKLMT